MEQNALERVRMPDQKPDPLRVVMVAGEASGDKQGAALIEALRNISSRPVVAWGVGGSAMRAAGVEIRHDCTRWAGIGVVATAAGIPHLINVLNEMKHAIAAEKPDVLVLIDAGAFNIPLGHWVKQHGICPIFYYFPPSSWRRTSNAGDGSKRRRKLAEASDRIVTPFPWSADNLSKQGCDAHFVGHPLLDLVKPSLSDNEFYDRFGLDPTRPLVAIMPGSRGMEIKHILPVMIGAAGEITRRVPGVQFAIALAPSASREKVENIIEKEQKSGGRATRLKLLINQAGKLAQIAHNTLNPPVVPQLATNEGITMPARTEAETAPHREKTGSQTEAPLVICEDLTYDVISRCDLVITKSGTSTLEAAILRKPMIIIYRGNALMAVEWRIRKKSLKIPYIGLPNIMAQEQLFPELLQDDATPEAICEYAVDVLLHPENTLKLKQRLNDIVAESLGEPGGVVRSAELLYDMVKKVSA